MTDLLDGIGRDVGIPDEVARRLTAMDETGERLGGSGETWVRIPVQGGSGSLTTEKKMTVGFTIQGTATIDAPPDGTWTVVVEDVVADKTVFQGSGLAQGKQHKWGPYTTGFWSQLAFTVQWSEPRDTELVIHLTWEYWAPSP